MARKRYLTVCGVRCEVLEREFDSDPGHAVVVAPDGTLLVVNTAHKPFPSWLVMGHDGAHTARMHLRRLTPEAPHA